MVSKLLDENKQPLSEKRHFKSFQTSPVPPRAETSQKDVPGLTSAMVEKELEWQMEEISTFYEYKLLKHQHVPYVEDVSHLKICLQDLVRKLEEDKKELIKEKSEILEERGLVIKQDKTLEDMQIKMSRLEEQLKHPELIGLKIAKQLRNQIEALRSGSSQEGEKVDNCPSSSTQKIATVELVKEDCTSPLIPALAGASSISLCSKLETSLFHQTQKSMTGYLKKLYFYLGNSSWLFSKLLLRSGCLCITVVLFYTLLWDATWTEWLLNIICHLYRNAFLWPH